MSDQIPLLEGESDDVLLLPSSELRKRYTGAQVDKIEHRRDPIIAMLGSGVFTLERIAAVCHVNVRTVKYLAEMHAASIAKDMAALGDLFLSESAKAVIVARDKRDAASYKDQMVGAGILATNGVAMKQASAGSSAADDAIDVQQVNEKADAARKWLQLKTANVKSEQK